MDGGGVPFSSMVDPTPFGLFLSSVEGQPVTRYGTKTLIGAERDRVNPTVVHYDTRTIVAIPHAELTRYRREYTDAIRDGSLRQRTAKQWVALQKRIAEAQAVRAKLTQPESV